MMVSIRATSSSNRVGSGRMPRPAGGSGSGVTFRVGFGSVAFAGAPAPGQEPRQPPGEGAVSPGDPADRQPGDQQDDDDDGQARQQVEGQDVHAPGFGRGGPEETVRVDVDGDRLRAGRHIDFVR